MVASAAAFGQTWVAAPTGMGPGERRDHAMAYDPVRREVVLWGGRDENLSIVRETWVWKAGVWTQRTVSPSPDNCAYSTSMAWDPVNQKILLFGGTVLSARSDETWTWDGVSWTELQPVNRPSARSSHNMAVDENSGRIVLVGGNNMLNESQDDTWEWDGSNWVVTVSSLPNIRRADAGMAWCPDANGIVLHGGVRDAGNGSVLSDTWVYSSSMWTQVVSAQGPMTGYGAMVTAPCTSQGQGVWLWGGANVPIPTVGELQPTTLWAFDGTTWSSSVQSPAPAARMIHEMCPTDQGTYLLFGGGSPGAAVSDAFQLVPPFNNATRPGTDDGLRLFSYAGSPHPDPDLTGGVCDDVKPIASQVDLELRALQGTGSVAFQPLFLLVQQRPAAAVGPPFPLVPWLHIDLFGSEPYFDLAGPSGLGASAIFVPGNTRWSFSLAGVPAMPNESLIVQGLVLSATGVIASDAHELTL